MMDTGHGCVFEEDEETKKMEQMFDLCCEYVYTLSFDYDMLA